MAQRSLFEFAPPGQLCVGCFAREKGGTLPDLTCLIHHESINPGFITQVLRSHLGHVLLTVSLCFILFVWFRTLNQPQFIDCVPAKDEFRANAFIVYPIWILAIAIAHFPSMALTHFVTKFFQGVFSLSCGATAKVEMPLFVEFSSVQWLLVGYTIETFGRWVRTRRRRTQQSIGPERG